MRGLRQRYGNILWLIANHDEELMAKATQPKMIHLKDYRPPAFLIDQVHLHFELHGDFVSVTAVLQMQRNPLHQDAAAPVYLNGEDMQLQRVSVDGKQLTDTEFQVDAISLTIPTVPDQFVLETEVIIKPQNNTQLMGLYKSRGNFCTQCEAQGFRRITYFPDRPDVMAKFTTTISADKAKYPMLLSNGNLIESRQLPNNRHWVHWEDPSKKPCYLFALVAGDFDLIQDHFTTMNNRKIDLRLYLEKGYRDQGAYAMQSLKKAMRWDEEKFDREYDLDIYMVVAVSDFNMGAMENKGLNIFNTKYILANPKVASDTDYVGILNVIGHEYFHNWSGNRVTCRDWFQITLKEGLTVLRDQLFIEDMISQAVMRINEVSVMRNQQFLEDAGPLAHPIRPRSYIEVNNFYTSTVYRKGAEVLRMVRTLLGEDAFREAMNLYFSRHDGQAVTTEDFIQAMSDSSGKDLSQFLSWYDQVGTPVLEVTGEYDAVLQTYTLNVSQSESPMHLPLVIGLVGEGCADLPLQLQNETSALATSRTLEITEQQQTFTFVNVPARPVPSLLRHFSAPVIVNFPYSDEELSWLIQCDSEPFARWDAAQTLAQRIVFSLVEQVRQGKSFYLNRLLNDAFEHVLSHLPDDLAYAAKLLSLPSEGFLLSQMADPDVESLHQACNYLRRKLAEQFEAKWRELFDQYRSQQKYSTDVGAMGRRALSNLCLSYLTETSRPQAFKLAYEHFANADNMTDSMGALVALNNHDCLERERALDEFYHRWQSEPLVVNKWLQLQASSSLPNTLTRVRELTHHAAFDINNPNKVYALLCGFGVNTVRFHETTGQGYQLIADQVLALDKLNPQVAARVVQPLTQWKRLDSAHAQLMQDALQRIQGSGALSQDLYEIVTKSLN